jgi:hypothetical protein
VRYVLEGQRKAGQRLRITGQLIDTTAGVHIRADRFDGVLDNIFELPDQVVRAIEPKLRQSEIDRATQKPTESLDAYDLYLCALAQFHKYTDEGMRDAIAIALTQLVVAIDPSYAPLAAMVGCAGHFNDCKAGPLSDSDVADCVRLARQAIEAGKDDPDAFWMAANPVSFFAGDSVTAADALTLNPGSAYAWLVRASVS